MLDEFRRSAASISSVGAGVHGRLWAEKLPAQSLNQIGGLRREQLILDNCHVRVSFATNDEHCSVLTRAGTATEMKAMKNYAGHRSRPGSAI